MLKNIYPETEVPAPLNTPDGIRAAKATRSTARLTALRFS